VNRRLSDQPTFRLHAPAMDRRVGDWCASCEKPWATCTCPPWEADEQEEPAPVVEDEPFLPDDVA
jgi:hypothetical protein